MLLANFNRKEHLRHRAVSLRQHGFLVSKGIACSQKAARFGNFEVAYDITALTMGAQPEEETRVNVSPSCVRLCNNFLSTEHAPNSVIFAEKNIIFFLGAALYPSQALIQSRMGHRLPTHHSSPLGGFCLYFPLNPLMTTVATCILCQTGLSRHL